MRYKNNLSTLSFGCMRLPKNILESEKLILHAINCGINYFDTAYIYPGNEEQLGKILEQNNCRNKIKIATKLPHYMIKKNEDLDKYFQIQLKRLRTDYIDYYLMHMLPDAETWQRLESLGILEWLEGKKKSGAIKKIGFSYHGGSKNFIELIDIYPWEFTQVQYNYMDEHSQAGRLGIEYAASKEIPVLIMEPLRGGLLANNLPSSAQSFINSYTPKRSAAEWALRWLWNQPAITTILSGMKTMDMLDENIRIANNTDENSSNPNDFKFYEKLKEEINKDIKVGCTGCSYCMPCPFGVNIPACFRCYNASYSDNYFKGIKEYIMTTAFSKDLSSAGQCRQCGKCIEHCPQSIKIPDQLNNVRHRFEHPIFKGLRWFIKHKMLRQK